MSEYIEREAFLDAIERGKKYQQDADDIAEMLQNFPAADVRPVVMCRDCKWTKKDDMDDPAIYCRKWDRWEMPPDGFCWLGRKKEES